jgi:hypothetical protein
MAHEIRPLAPDEEATEIVKPCTICGAPTAQCCVDCGIDSGGEAIPHVCERTECMDRHEATHARGP